MTKKTTLRDVAREAGVSVATVSYIMNNRTDQKISDATRKKVLQIANLLDYTPNSTAKSLATGRHNLIGIAYQFHACSPSRNMEVSAFVNMLMNCFSKLGYDILMVPVPFAEDTVTFHHNVDAVIAIDLTHEDFVRLADNIFVPVISVDMLINDKLFYQIYSDLPRLITQAKETLGEDLWLILDRYCNQNYLQFITESVPASHVRYLDELDPATLQSLRGQKALAIGCYAGLLLQSHIPAGDLAVITAAPTEHLLLPQVQVIKNDLSLKADTTVNIVLNTLDKKFDLPHDVKV